MGQGARLECGLRRRAELVLPMLQDLHSELGVRFSEVLGRLKKAR